VSKRVIVVGYLTGTWYRVYNKRNVDTIKSSLLQIIIYKTQKHYTYFQSILKEKVFTKVLKMPSSQAWLVRSPQEGVESKCFS
jgi:hypothetical protein